MPMTILDSNYKSRSHKSPSGHLWHFILVNQQSQKEILTQVEVIESGQYEDIGLLQDSESGEMFEFQVIHFGFYYPLLTVNKQIQLPWAEKCIVSKGFNLLPDVGINNRPNKQISTIEVLAKKKLCLKYVVKEKDIEYLLQCQKQLQQQNLQFIFISLTNRNLKQAVTG